MAQNRHQVARTTRRVFGRNNYNQTLEIAVDPERQLEISRERRANLVPAEVLYLNNRSTARHRVYEHYSEQRILCVDENQINLQLCNEESYEKPEKFRTSAYPLGDIHDKATHTTPKKCQNKCSKVAIKTRGYDTWQGGESNLLITMALTGRLSNTSYMGFQYSVENVVDHLTTTGITAIPGERRSIEELEGMSWHLKPPEQTSVRVPSRVAVNERLNRSVSLRFERYRQTPQPPRYLVDQHDREVIRNDNLDEDEEHFIGICLQTPQEEHISYDVCFCENCLNEARILEEEPLNKVRRSNKPKRSRQRSWERWSTLGEPSGKWDYYVKYDAPPDTTPIEEIAATGWGDEFSDDEVTPGKVTILEERSDWDDDERSGRKGEHLAIQKQELESESENPFAAKRGKTFSGGYGEYYNSEWTLPPAWTESRVMLVLPADPALCLCGKPSGESEKLMWQQWRTVFLEAYSALKAIADEPQNITSQVRQLILLEDPYRGSTDEQDRAYRDLDRITCEETKNLWSFLEDFRQLATKSGRLYFPSTTEKLFAKLPPSLSKKIEESFKAKYPGLNSGVLPAIKFTHTFVSEMCKDAALAKELRDLSLCSAIPIPGYYKNNRKKYGMRKSRTYKGKPHNSHVKPFKRKYKDDRGRVKKCKCFICGKEWHFAKDCRSKQGNIARSAVYQELDLDDNWDIISADFDDSSIYSISKGEGNTHQSISVMVHVTPRQGGNARRKQEW
ncbi:Orf y [Tanacetum coccineum]